MPGVEDNLVNGWTAEDKRSLLDLVTGGKYSEAKDLPPLSTTGKITDENIFINPDILGATKILAEKMIELQKFNYYWCNMPAIKMFCIMLSTLNS